VPLHTECFWTSCERVWPFADTENMHASCYTSEAAATYFSGKFMIPTRSYALFVTVAVHDYRLLPRCWWNLWSSG
jgi:hypothetical protein